MRSWKNAGGREAGRRLLLELTEPVPPSPAILASVPEQEVGGIQAGGGKRPSGAILLFRDPPGPSKAARFPKGACGRQAVR